MLWTVLQSSRFVYKNIKDDQIESKYNVKIGLSTDRFEPRSPHSPKMSFSNTREHYTISTIGT